MKVKNFKMLKVVISFKSALAHMHILLNILFLSMIY